MSTMQHYILYPVVCGFVALPKLKLVVYPDTPQAQPLDELVESCIPSELQIMVSFSLEKFFSSQEIPVK